MLLMLVFKLNAIDSSLAVLITALLWYPDAVMIYMIKVLIFFYNKPYMGITLFMLNNAYFSSTINNINNVIHMYGLL